MRSGTTWLFALFSLGVVAFSSGCGSRTITTDTQQLANDVLNDSFARLLQSSRIEGKVLRLRDHTE